MLLKVKIEAILLLRSCQLLFKWKNKMDKNAEDEDTMAGVYTAWSKF